MKVRAKRLFKDKFEKVVREHGEIFVVNQDRFKELNSTDHGVLVEEVKEKKTEEVKDQKSTKEK